MEKVKPVGFVIGLMLLILAAVIIYLSAKGLLTIPSANSYQDNGTHTFEPYQVLPVQVRNTPPACLSSPAGSCWRRTSISMTATATGR
jgi:hypothetical protein